MITAALFGALLVARAVVGASRGGGPSRVPVVDRLLLPVGLAFAALLALRLIDLWVSNA